MDFSFGCQADELRGITSPGKEVDMDTQQPQEPTLESAWQLTSICRPEPGRSPGNDLLFLSSFKQLMISAFYLSSRTAYGSTSMKEVADNIRQGGEMDRNSRTL